MTVLKRQEVSGCHYRLSLSCRKFNVDSRTGRSRGADLVTDDEFESREVLVIRGQVLGEAVLRRVVGGRHHQPLPAPGLGFILHIYNKPLSAQYLANLAECILQETLMAPVLCYVS